jgi:hypothetical protein
LVTDSSLRVTEAKVRTASNQVIDLVPTTSQQATGAFSLANLPGGVYTLDVITQKGNAKAAYEGVLSIGQQPLTVIEETTKRVTNEYGDLIIIFSPGPCDLPNPPPECEPDPCDGPNPPADCPDPIDPCDGPNPPADCPDPIDPIDPIDPVDPIDPGDEEEEEEDEEDEEAVEEEESSAEDESDNNEENSNFG